MNSITWRAVLGLTAAAGMAVTAAAADMEWRGWNIHPDGYPNTVGMAKFAELVAEKTDGRISLEMYNSGTLGSQPDAIEQVRIGALEVGNFNLGPIGPIAPAANVVSLPFIFKDEDHMHRVLDGEGGKAIAEGMAEQGLVVLAWYDAGARSFYNTKKPIATPADVEGMKVRVMNNDLYSGMIEQLGGNPSPMAFAEVYQSLKTGVVDGAENNWPSYVTTNHYKVARHYTLTEHTMIPEVLVMSRKAWDALSPEDQKIFKDAARESSNYMNLQWRAWEERAREEARSAGNQIIELIDRAPFEAAMKPIYDEAMRNPRVRELVERIRAVK